MADVQFRVRNAHWLSDPLTEYSKDPNDRIQM